MLMPSKVKFRKQQRGKRAGKAQTGSTLSFGEFGLKSLENCWVTARQIEASRVAMTRFVKRGGQGQGQPGSLGGGHQGGPHPVRDGRGR